MFEEISQRSNDQTIGFLPFSIFLNFPTCCKLLECLKGDVQKQITNRLNVFLKSSSSSSFHHFGGGNQSGVTATLATCLASTIISSILQRVTKRMTRTWGICTRRAGKLYKARSRLHRSQLLQVNTRWKALAEIYTIHSFAPFSWNLVWLKRYILLV